MKLKYVVLLEILRIMVSVSQIFDAKLTFKPSREVQKFRKPSPKNNSGSLICLYGKKEHGKGVTKLVSETKMDRVWLEF